MARFTQAKIQEREHLRQAIDLASINSLQRAVHQWELVHGTFDGHEITAGGAAETAAEEKKGLFSVNDLLAHRLVPV